MKSLNGLFKYPYLGMTILRNWYGVHMNYFSSLCGQLRRLF